jgi:succinoglycan biosynthesis transport protein ExoP
MELPIAELKKHLKILIRRKTLFIILSLCIFSAMVWGSYLMPKKYKAESTVFIERNVINKLVEGIAITPSMEDRLRVLNSAMLSRGLVLKVLRDLDLDTKTKNDKELEEMITDYQKNTTINMSGNDLFTVSMIGPNPTIVTNYVNTLIRKYIEENLSAKREESYGAGRFLKEQLASLKEKIDKADADVIKFRQQKGIILSEDEKSIVTDIKGYKSQIDDLRVGRNELVAALNTFKKQLESVQPYTVSLLKHSQKTDVAALQKRLSELLIRYTENYPEVIKLEAEIEAIKKQETSAFQKTQKSHDSSAVPEESSINPIYQELTQRSLETESDIQSADARQKQLLSMMAARENELKNIPANKKKLAELEQVRDANQELYDKLLQRQGQSEVSKEMEVEDKSTTFRVVDPAIIPPKPFSPNRAKIFVMAIFVGLVGGFAGVFVRDGFDSSVRQEKTLKDLGLQILAVIPNIYNEEEQEEKVKREKILYAVTGSYFLFVCMTMVLEFMGYNYFDRIVTHLNLSGLF